MRPITIGRESWLFAGSLMAGQRAAAIMSQYMQTLLQGEIKHQRRSQHTFCQAILDVDHFKQVNDRHGLAVGYTVLRELARIAQACTGEANTLARRGGEAFLVLVPDTTPLGHARVGLERLRGALQHDVVSMAQPALRITYSAGVVTMMEGESLGHELERADQALCRVKAQGRDRYVLADAAISGAAGGSPSQQGPAAPRPFAPGC